MRLNFRQGIVKSQLDLSLSPYFLLSTPSGINLLGGNTPVVLTLADGLTDYQLVENADVVSAWPNTTSASPVWLYWDIDKKTALRTFGSTPFAPVHGPIPPIAPQDTQHWFNTTTSKMMVWSSASNMFVEKIRVFAAKFDDGLFDFFSIGSQVGISSTSLIYRAGKIAFDGNGKPVVKADKTFFTTGDQFFTAGSVGQGTILESNLIFAKAQEPLPAFSVVKFSAFGQLLLADYEDIGSTVLGIVSEDAVVGNDVIVTVQGVIVNPNWNFPVVGDKVWVDVNGSITSVDPNLSNPLRIKQVPIARVLTSDSIIFEQGLGGKGDKGDPGNISGVSPATTTTHGLVRLATPPAIPSEAIAIGANDPRLNDARTPIAHGHQATEIVVTPTGGITSANAQSAFIELDNLKLDKSGGAITGNLSLLTNPTLPAHATPKSYVDGKVSGLKWNQPICLVNLISDVISTPPSNPEHSDAYIIATGGTGLWVGLDGHLVIWNKYSSLWEDRGVFTTIVNTMEYNRYGISLRSSTIASGTFLGQDNNIATYDTIDTTWTFYTPVENDAVLVCNDISLHAYNQYVFDNQSNWILFGGPQPISAGNFLALTGNVLDVTIQAGDNLSFSGNTLNVVGVDSSEWVQTGDVHRTSNQFWNEFSPGDANWTGSVWNASSNNGIILRTINTWPIGFRPTGLRLMVSQTIPGAVTIRDFAGNIIGTVSSNYSSGTVIPLTFGPAGDVSKIEILSGNTTVELSDIVFIVNEEAVGAGPYIAGKNLEFTGSTLDVVGLQEKIEPGTLLSFNGNELNVDLVAGTNLSFAGNVLNAQGSAGWVDVSTVDTVVPDQSFWTPVVPTTFSAPNYTTTNDTVTLDVQGTWAVGYRPTELLINANTSAISIQLIDNLSQLIFEASEFNTGTAIPIDFNQQGNNSDINRIVIVNTGGSPFEVSKIDFLLSVPVPNTQPYTTSNLLKFNGSQIDIDVQALFSQVRIPYDLAFFIAGEMLEDTIVGSFLTARNVRIESGAPNSLAIAKVGPSTNVIYSLLHNNISVGTVTFQTASTTGIIDVPSEVNMVPGDVFEIKSQLISDTTITDVSITIVGCSLASLC